MGVKADEAGFFRTLMEFCSTLRGRGIRSERVETLDDKIRELTNHQEKIKITGQKIDTFCMLVKEINPFHTNAEFAKQHNFQDRFAPGTMIASLGEQFYNGLIGCINEVASVTYIPISGKLNFGLHPIFPDTNLLWVFYGFSWGENGDLSLKMVGGDNKKIRGVDWSKVTRRNIRDLGCSLDIISNQSRSTSHISLYGPEISPKSYLVTGEDLDKFTDTVDDNSRKPYSFPYMYASSFIISALLDLQKEVTGKVSGIHIGTDFEFYGLPEVGKEFKVEFFFRGEDFQHFRNQSKSRWRIDAVISQDHKPLIYSEIAVLSEKSQK